MTFNSFPVFLIAHNEFKKVVGHPIVIIIALVLIMISALNGITSSGLSGFEKIMPNDDVLIKVALSGMFWHVSEYCTIAAMFIGLISIAGDRYNGSLNVLVSKPLYRKNVVVGKFLGISLFVLLLVSVVYVVSALLIMLFYRAPLSPTDFLLRFTALIVLLFLECSLTVGITMLVGIVFKNMVEAAVITASFLYVEWYTTLPHSIGELGFLFPSSLYIKIFSTVSDPRFTGLLDTSMDFMEWAGLAYPYILLMVLYIIVVLLIDSFVFTKVDD
ncbi:ABC transporter permease [Methanocella conradii]|uniref:ABC transporter permease n=1 Tax=Methanocella conradii TaxID=1175444 RepID=UPI0024B36C1E|nr:ABC transporter permease subunit [Methanocella conradii]MDI6897877.1 ABC transporter permease subunit [Methanocella conradii]